MPLPVKLRDVVNEMDLISETFRAFINPRTGELVTLTEDMIEEAEGGLDFEEEEEEEEEDDEMTRKVKEILESDDFLELPDQHEIHEWSIMERFSESVDNDDWSSQLLTAISGRGAFRYFKDTIHRLGIQKDWYAFRDEAFKEIARDFLEAHEIPFVEDAKDESA